MDLLLKPKRLRGRVTPPPGKSETLRLILAAALAEGESRIEPVALSGDVQATLACAKALGASCRMSGEGALCIRGRREQGEGQPVFDCGEAGAALRFFLPVSLALCGGGDFIGRGRLLERPLAPYLRALAGRGIEWKRRGDRLCVRGTLTPGEYLLPGDVSSQFFSGLLFALPLLKQPSRLRWTTEPESADYIEMTLDALRRAGVTVQREADGFSVAPGRYRPLIARVEPDWTQAALWLSMRELGNELQVDGMNELSAQGDRRILCFLERLRGPGERVIELAHNPDLLPPLAVVAALRQGSTRLAGAARLRYKESDRLQTVTAALRALGAAVEEERDALWINGCACLRGGAAVDCAGDHRIAMMAAAAATRCERELVLRGADCVKKSYPDFWEQYQRLGGDCHVVDLGK